SPEQATAGQFDVLLIDDVCSFLTPRLVGDLKQTGVEVIGVYVPEDGSDAKRRLLECGISDVIESGAGPEEFLDKIGQTLAHRLPVATETTATARPLSIAVTGPTAGVGVSETSVALAVALASKVETLLLDLDPVWPSVAQRLDLGVHPNVRTAVDHALHRPDKLGEAIHRVGKLAVIGGVADGGKGNPIGRHEVLALVDTLRSQCDVVVADVGPVFDVVGGVLREFDAVIVVGTTTPVGVGRLIRAVEHVAASTSPGQSIVAVLNLSDNGFQRGEAIDELHRIYPDLPVLSLPTDRSLAVASWDGTVKSGRSYRKAVDAMSDVVARTLA
ncbi:MAG TPA: hypothetical protein VI141_06020, partial [Acidimicrobiia bacterium]